MRAGNTQQFANNRVLKKMSEEHNKEKIYKDQKDSWVMYLIIRYSLGMSAGKIGAQCGHAVGMIYEKYIDINIPSSILQEAHLINAFSDWKSELYRKIVLKADDKEWEKIKKELSCFVVR